MMSRPFFPASELTEAEEVWIRDLQPAVDVDHAFSQGRKIYLITDFKSIDASKRAPEDLPGKLAGPWEGLCHYAPNGHIYIVIGGAVTKLRFLELLVHEVSHAVDRIFSLCGIKKVDTEVRAYHMDWIFGKMLHQFPEYLEDVAEAKEKGHCPSRVQ